MVITLGIIGITFAVLLLACGVAAYLNSRKKAVPVPVVSEKPQSSFRSSDVVADRVGTLSGTMPIGVRYGDAILTNFTVRPLTAGDEMDAVDLCLDADKTTHGAVTLARLAIVTDIEYLPKSVQTLDMMRSMHKRDIEAIQRVYEDMERNFTEAPVQVS